MKNHIIVPCICVAVVVMALLTCSSKNKHDREPAFVLGTDTLSLAEIRGMAPDSAPVKDKIARAALQMTLSRESGHPCGNVRDSGLYSDLSNQLSLRTGAAWSAQSASCLYSAAKAVRLKFKELPTARAVAAYVDSLFLRTVHCDSGVRRSMAVNDSLLATLDNTKTRQNLENLLRSIFHISAQTAVVLADFLVSENTENAKAADVSSYVKGLVADTHLQAQQAASAYAPAPNASVPQDPKRALKYRPQKLISDSIKKHIPNLEALYKKHLKTHPGLSGTVWVIFVILPDGSIASTQIHSADIGEKDFLNPFSQYVQRIRFSKIPDPVGPMTFEFPFEFSPEN